jgi:predicted alpha/beta-fold hydrolase
MGSTVLTERTGRGGMTYRSPWWLPGGNLQTIWAASLSRRVDSTPPTWQRERWGTPDQDFVDVDWLLDGPAGAPRESSATALLVLFHGLEGSSASHYAQAFACMARLRNWRFAVPHFRGCSGEVNLAPRAYHSGDHGEIDWILRRFKARHGGPVLAVGVSLGGNALMRWAGEQGSQARSAVEAVASVCSPLDLTAGGQALGQGFNRLVYTPMFLKSMVPKALAKLQQHPGLFDRDALLRARDLYAFDNVFTAPLHGFGSTETYWREASAKPLMRGIQVPALALNALNDPFIPAWSLPTRAELSPFVELWQPAQGGHVGFPAPDRGWPATHALAMPQAVVGFLAQHLHKPRSAPEQDILLPRAED